MLHVRAQFQFFRFMDADAILRLAVAGAGAASSGSRGKPGRKRKRPNPEPNLDDAVDASSILGLQYRAHRARRQQRAPTVATARKKEARIFKAQAILHDRRGSAKTADSYLHRGGKHKCVVKGTSRFRRWTPEAILHAASREHSMSWRSSAPAKSSPESARQCKMIVANCIAEGQDRGLGQICAASKEAQLLFVINNTMYDETKLPFGKHRRRKLRCLAWHSQCSFSGFGDEAPLVDNDVFRPPQVMKAYTAANVWAVVSRADDTASMFPRGDALPNTIFFASLTAADSHAVNILTSKYLAAQLPRNHFHLASYCVQHRTGSTCEEITKKWNLLSPSFCLAVQLENGDFHDSLRTAVIAVLRKYLHCVPSVDAAVDDYEFGEEEAERLRDFAAELLRVCYVQALSENCTGDDDVEEKKSQRKAKSEQFLRFFPPPWSGVLRHHCPAHCCGLRPCHDREQSIMTGADLIMSVVLAPVSRPAANRYTRLFPVGARITLMLNFHGVCKRALRLVLKDAPHESDDDYVLQDVDALVGAPRNEMQYYRKLQARDSYITDTIC